MGGIDVHNVTIVFHAGGVPRVSEHKAEQT